MGNSTAKEWDGQEASSGQARVYKEVICSLHLRAARQAGTEFVGLLRHTSLSSPTATREFSRRTGNATGVRRNNEL